MKILCLFMNLRQNFGILRSRIKFNVYNRHDCYLITYLPFIIVTVTSFIVTAEDESDSPRFLPRTKPGCLGCGNDDVSLFNIITTDGIIGLSSIFSWTHIRPTFMHLITSASEYESAYDESISSIAFPSFHSLHAYHNT